MSSIEVKFDDSPEIQAILNETTIAYPPVDDSVSIPEPVLILSAIVKRGSSVGWLIMKMKMPMAAAARVCFILLFF